MRVCHVNPLMCPYLTIASIKVGTALPPVMVLQQLLRNVGTGAGISFFVLGIEAISNALSSYIMPGGRTLEDILAGFFGGQ